MPENPYKPISAASADAEPSQPKDISATQAAYNIVSDTVTGLNVRKSDNKFQAVFIFYVVLACQALGGVVTWFNPQWKLPWPGGCVIGGFGGLIVGVLTSGTFLMIYRGKRHIEGKHD